VSFLVLKLGSPLLSHPDWNDYKKDIPQEGINVWIRLIYQEVFIIRITIPSIGDFLLNKFFTDKKDPVDFL